MKERINIECAIDDYERERVAVHDREKGMCQICGDPLGLEEGNTDYTGDIHYVLKPSEGGVDSLDNLYWAHWGCHSEFHFSMARRDR